MALPASDNFDDTDSTPAETHNSSWLELGFNADSVTMYAINTNALYQAQTAPSCLRWNADTFDNDQYSQVTLAAMITSGSGRLGPAVRINPTADGTGDAADVDCYALALRNFGATSRFLYLVENGSETLLDSDGTAPTVTSVYKIEANGTTITAYEDDVEILSATDATLSSGSAGIYANNCGTTAKRLDDWEGGNLGGAPAGNGYASRLSLLGVG